MLVDVVDPRLYAPVGGGDGEAVVLVEPLYGSVALALALDAGWGSVELAGEVGAAAPIPLVSFEQPPPPEHREGRCRVRCGDLAADARRIGEVVAGTSAQVLAGAPALARPLCAQLAFAEHVVRVSFVPVLSGGAVAMDSWWACGMLARVLLDELTRDSTLTEGAGIAVTLATGAEDVHGQLSAGARWARHLERGGAPDDARVAAAVDVVGIVPALVVDGDGPLVASPWRPAAG